MSAAPQFLSGGFRRDQLDNIGVFLVDLDGAPYVAAGGGGGAGGVVQMQFREGGAWVNAPGTAARGLLTDPISGTTDGAVGLPARVDIVGGYDGTNSHVLKTSAAGVLQVDVLTFGASVNVGNFPATQAVTDGGGSLTVDGTITVQDGGGSLTVDGSVSLAAALPAGTNNIGDVDVLTLPALPAGGNNIGDVDVVGGLVAHDGVDSGNPIKVGARARTADVTAVAQDDRIDAIATILGKQVVQNYALPSQFINGMLATALTGTTAADVIAAPAAGVRLYITEITVTNHHATVDTKVEIRDGTTVKKVVSAAHLGGGASITLPTPLRLTAATALTARPVTTGADVDVSASGYTAAE